MSFWIGMAQSISVWAIPLLLVSIPLVGLIKRIPVYEVFVEGAKEGFQVGVRIIPFLVAILVAIGMFRASGAMEFIGRHLQVALQAIGIPVDVLPLALMRPLSGSGSLGILQDIVQNSGPDSLVGRTAAVMYGSTETTFYVLAVYFGSVGIRKSRHAVAAGLLADLAGILSAVWIVRFFMGHAG
jgi:spore maturation protein B